MLKFAETPTDGSFSGTPISQSTNRTKAMSPINSFKPFKPAATSMVTTTTNINKFITID